MSDPFKDSKLRCERGKENAADLKRRIRSFIKTDPYTCVVEPDPDGINEWHKIKFTKSLPDDLATVTADAVGNFRAALDKACYVIATGSNAKFPFAESFSELQGRLKTKDFPNDIKPLFMRFKPYKGGHDLLWALNRICNTNKHEMLSPLGVGFQIKRVVSNKVVKATDIPLGRWDSSKNEIICAVIGPDESIEYEAEFTFAVTFGEVEVVKGQPVIIVLDQLASTVDSILAIIEAEARRLGYI